MALTSIIKPVQLVLLWAAASAALQPAAPLTARATVFVPAPDNEYGLFRAGG